MNEKIILSLKEEPVDVFQAKEFKKLIKYATENQAQLESYWENESIENIQMFLKYATSKLSFFEKHIENEKKNHSIFRLGSLLGAVESYGNILYERKQQQLAIDKVYKEGRTIKYLDNIVSLLENHGGLTHSELCKYLKLKTSTLSEAIKRVIAAGVVNTHVSGKYKIYSLSDVGIRYGKYLRNQKRIQNKNVQILELLEQSISKISSSSELEELKKCILEILNVYSTLNRNEKVILHIDGPKEKEVKFLIIDAIENNINGRTYMHCKLDEIKFNNEKIVGIRIPNMYEITKKNFMSEVLS